MLRARSMNRPALAVLSGLIAGTLAIAQEKPKDATTGVSDKAAGATAAKEVTKSPEPPKPRVAVFRLAGSVGETPKEEILNFGGETGTSLETLVSRMDKAAKDSAVKAVVILLDQPTVGSAQVEELRQAISRLRGREGGHRSRRHDRWPGSVHPALGGVPPERRSHGRPLGHGHLRRVALPSPSARKAGSQTRFHDLRRLQERRRDLSARGPQQRGRGHAELAARQPLRHPGETDCGQPQGEPRACEGVDR